MNKDEAVALMLESINYDNRQFCQDMGMSEEEIDKNIQQSQVSLGAMMSNMYDRMVEQNIIVI